MKMLSERRGEGGRERADGGKKATICSVSVKSLLACAKIIVQF